MSLINKFDNISKTYNKNKNKLDIICDGDSWTFGCEIVDPKLVKKHPTGTYVGVFDFEEENDRYRRARIFSHHIAEKLDANVVNLSWPADDNGSILNRTIHYITANYLSKGLPVDNVMVIVGWSSPERNHFWFKDDKTGLSMKWRLWPQVQHFDHPMQKKMWDMYVSYLWNPEEYMFRYIMHVMQLQNFCNAHGIAWMCYNSFYQTPGKHHISQWEDINVREELDRLYGHVHGYQYQIDAIKERQTEMFDLTTIWDTVDPVRFYKKDLPGNTFKSFVENPTNKVKTPFNGLHPSPAGHKAWASELVRYIEEHGLLP